MEKKPLADRKAETSGIAAMKKAQTSREAMYGPLRKKTFRAALVRELREQVPTLGDLTADALAGRIERLVDEFHPPAQRLRMGQIVWPAVDEREKGGWGKSIERTAIKPVVLEAVTYDDISGLLAGVKRKDLRVRTVLRLFHQAKQQGGVLTGVDAAAIVGVSPATISRYVRGHEKATGKLVPRRGTVHDMGPSLTHKRQICRRVILEGDSIEETARATDHSPEAVTRYVQDYRRVSACLKGGLTIGQTAYATKMTRKLVVEYQDLMREHCLQSDEEDDNP
jgi:transposase-like protein